MTTGLWPEAVVVLVTRRLALLADPSRVRLLGLLEQRGEASVHDLAEEMDSTPQNVSRHLRLLYDAGVVERRREGACVFYALVDYSACRLLDQALASVTGQISELADLVKHTA